MPFLPSETKTGALVSRINDITWIEVESELDALILEAELIKKYKPKYNIIQKDDKTYLYIVIRNELITINAEKNFTSKSYHGPQKPNLCQRTLFSAHFLTGLPPGLS